MKVKNLPTQKQIELLTRLHLRIPEDRTEASELISETFSRMNETKRLKREQQKENRIRWKSAHDLFRSN